MDSSSLYKWLWNAFRKSRLFTPMRAWLKHSARISKEKLSLPEKNKDIQPLGVKPTPGSPMAHSIEMDRLALDNAALAVKLDAVTKELVEAKAAMKKIEADYNTEVCTKLKMDIQTVIGCTDAERDKLCHGKTDVELSMMLDNFVTATRDRTPVGQESGIFKPIRTGAAEPHKYGDQIENFTVGNLFGMTREDILKSGGKF